MITVRSLRAAVPAALTFGVLALPAAASAHPSVFEIDAKVAQATTPVTFADQRQYVVNNHGFALVLRESNGVTDSGVVNYKLAPSALRSQAGFDALTEADSGAQAHATCTAPALTDPTAIRAWQGADPFYAYVPFQKASAGLEDDPAAWMAVVKDRTGIDLSTVADASAACASIGGTLRPADATVTTTAAFSSGAIGEAKKPLETKVTELTADGEAARAETSRVKSELASVKAELDGWKAEATRMQRALRPLRVKTGASSAKGMAVTVSGPAGRRVVVRALLDAKQAERLGLGSRVLGRAQVTVGADGVAHARIAPAAKAAKAMRAHDGKLAVTVGARTGDRWTTASTTLGG
jgi:hypothetical protein